MVYTKVFQILNTPTELLTDLFDYYIFTKFAS